MLKNYELQRSFIFNQEIKTQKMIGQVYPINPLQRISAILALQ